MSNALVRNKTVMSRVWETSSALLTAISEKIVTVKKPEPCEKSDKLKAVKAIDSAKIQIRLLAKEKALSSLKRIAEATDEQDIASFAVSHLLDFIDEEAAEVKAHLTHLASSDSHACLPAIISLFNSSCVEIAQSVLLERLSKGEYFYLIEKKKARAILFLDILGAVDEYGNTNYCFENFPKVWHSLASRPDDQMNLLSEILGDLNPGGIRYLPDDNMIPKDVKMQAVQLLYALKPANYERALWYGSRDKDDDVSYAATMISAEHWQSPEGCVPESLEPFRMLNLDFLFYLCQKSSMFSWKGPDGISQLFDEWNRDMDELDSLDQLADPHRHACLKNKTERAREQLVKITEQRLNTLQPLVDTITDALQLPHAKIQSTDTCGIAAAYLVGTGTVEFSKNVLLDDKPLTEEFMSSMLHELGHMEQDVLIIRMFADEIGLKYGQHGPQIKELFERYSKVIGYVPDSIFLLEVLRLRADRPLSPAELQRANRLLEAARHNVQSNETNKRLSDRLDRLDESLVLVDKGVYDMQILECLRDENSLTALFESGHVPGIMVEESRNCRRKIDAIVAEMSIPPAANLAPQIRLNTLKKDSISQAQELLSQNSSRALAEVVERFRIVFSHMLHEEARRLDKRISEIRREGYHEAEAYTISDRVEVIVKALRHGWFQFSSQ